MQSEYQYYIGGEWRESKEKLFVKNPYNNDFLCTTFLAGERDINDAIHCSINAFYKTKKLPSYKRSEILSNIAEGIIKRSDELSKIITLEAGKPITDSRAEVERAIGTFQIAQEESKRMTGEYIPLDISIRSKNRTAINYRFPIGPILGITPFNFPLNLVAHKVAAAFASGNPIIIKPSPKTPITALVLAEIISESGWPRNGFSVLSCEPALTEKLVADENIKMLTFTGSDAVGWKLKQVAEKKRVTLELGGNAATIIDRNDNLDDIVKRCITSAYSFCGQVCISLERLFINKVFYDDFIHCFLDGVKKLHIGNPMEVATQLGSMIDERSAERIELWVNEAVKEGARILCGGKRTGSFYEPTILTNTSQHMKVHSNELFAPVVTVSKFDTLEQAVDLVNDSIYGLQASVFTNNIKDIFYAYENLEVGGIITNDVPSFRVDHMPYGGTKGSGIGREGIHYAMEEMTEQRLLVLNLS